MAAVYHEITGARVILPSPTLLLCFCQFPSWHKARQSMAWVNFPCCSHTQVVSMAHRKLLFRHNRWQSEVRPANVCCHLMLRLFTSLTLSLYHFSSFSLSVFSCVQAKVQLLCDTLILTDKLYICSFFLPLFSCTLSH